MADRDEAARELAASFATWLRGERVETLLPRERILDWAKEVAAQPNRLDALKPRFDAAWRDGEERWRKEERTLRAVLGKAGKDVISFFIASPD